MASPVLGVVLDSSIVITAERRQLPVPQLIEQGYAVLTENARHFQKIPFLN